MLIFYLKSLKIRYTISIRIVFLENSEKYLEIQSNPKMHFKSQLKIHTPFVFYSPYMHYMIT